jgi:hypothetical protein
MSRRGNVHAYSCHRCRMPPNNQSAEKALAGVRTAARRNRAAAGTPDAAAARKALRYAVAAAANCGIKQTLIAKAAGLSKAQVSRVARGASSGKTTLPPATYLVDTLPSDEIVERYRSGETTYDLSRAYECSNTTIINILKQTERSTCRSPTSTWPTGTCTTGQKSSTWPPSWGSSPTWCQDVSPTPELPCRSGTAAWTFRTPRS